MDLSSLETQHQVQATENHSFIEGVNSLRKEILSLEEQENEWLGSADTKGLEEKVSDLRSTNTRCHELLRTLLEKEKHLQEFTTSQVQIHFKAQMEECLGHDRAANKARRDYLKSKLRIEQEYKLLLTKRIKDLTKSLVTMTISGHKKSSGKVSLRDYLNERLKCKQIDLERLNKQNARFEKLNEKVVERGEIPDDISITSALDTESEACSEISPLSKVLHDNIALTLEKQKLEDELKFFTEKNRATLDRIAECKDEEKVLREKLESFSFEKEELLSTEEAMQAAEADIANYLAEIATVQNEVDQNNAQIHKVKDEIIQLQAQLKDRKDDEDEQAESRHFEEDLSRKKLNLEKLTQEAQEKVKNNSILREQNKLFRLEFEKNHLKNLEMEKQLQEKRVKSEKEINELKWKVIQLERDVQSTNDNIKVLTEEKEELDKKIDATSVELVKRNEKLESHHNNIIHMNGETEKIKAEITELTKIVSTKNEEKAELIERFANLEVKLQEKKKEHDKILELLTSLRQDNELAKTMLQEIQEAEKKPQPKEAAAWLPQMFSNWFNPKTEDQP